ncbi:hypothetical protein P154DRAFT_520350 [Amniculicola lignicola CBS 123094]|uniref:C3H1-type domain-containing protein n=1 Tax=Amniculicola lignicola CBS 123094 TaxID=1392246 RepID=A0A6A5WQD8_9PLEO|nr:hypothetical protein P154DRAFT_520350 [Amniculicola lignicola CBS 123094]
MADIDLATMNYAAQLESFQRSDEARQRLVTDLLEKYQILAQRHKSLKNDFMSEQDIRRMYQSQKDDLQKQVDDTKLALDGSSFVLTLIDGDGVVFQDMLLAAGANGGSEAASKLQQAIKEHIATLYSNSGSWPIMVNIFVSLDKLAAKLAQVGLLKHPTEMRGFAQSFSVNQPLFSIIDVGHGKERADFRIKEMLRTFNDNPTCKHIIFGGCHDGGYLLNLDGYKHHAVKAARITLLESTPAVQGFRELPNFRRARFDHVFRSEPLPPNPTNGYIQATAAAHMPPAPAPLVQTTPPVQVPVRSMSTHSFATTNTPSTASPLQGSPSISISSMAGQADPSNTSWATVGKTGVDDGGVTIPLKENKKKMKTKYMYFNKEGYRLDEKLPPRDQSAVVSIDTRMKHAKKNLCNHWHLNNGNCANGKFCKFQHEPKLSAAEVLALRYKARSLPCKRPQCEDIDCYLGHQCTNERDNNGYCSYGGDCHLSTSHGMDRVKHVRLDQDWNEEYAK